MQSGKQDSRESDTQNDGNNHLLYKHTHLCNKPINTSGRSDFTDETDSYNSNNCIDMDDSVINNVILYIFDFVIQNLDGLKNQKKMKHR